MQRNYGNKDRKLHKSITTAIQNKNKNRINLSEWGESHKSRFMSLKRNRNQDDDNHSEDGYNHTNVGGSHTKDGDATNSRSLMMNLILIICVVELRKESNMFPCRHDSDKGLKIL